MKFSIIILFLAPVLISGFHCKKNKHSNPLDQLPPETQTGANTFGCLVNGQLFKPGGAALAGGSWQCNYQSLPGGYYLVLIGRNQTGNNLLSSVGLFTDSMEIQEGAKLDLKLRMNGNSSGDYFKALSASQYEEYITDNNMHSGQLMIKKFDPVNQVISGTFWFDVVTGNGKMVQVREGRFDTHYTR